LGKEDHALGWGTNSHCWTKFIIEAFASSKQVTFYVDELIK